MAENIFRLWDRITEFIKDEQRQKPVQGDFNAHILDSDVIIFFKFDTVNNIQAKSELRFPDRAS